MKTCKVCGTVIPEGRLKAIPHADTCAAHSSAAKFSANVVQHGVLEDDGFQEIEVVRDSRVSEQLEHYRNQLGKYQ